jgi:hypothetical protein
MSALARISVAVLGLALLAPAAASASVQKAVYTEDSSGVSGMDPQDGFAACLGYTGYVAERRHGEWKLTIGKSDVHVEGQVKASFRIFPASGQRGATYTGSYVEHDVGRFVPGPDGDVPSPNAMFELRGTGRGSDGSLLRFQMLGQTHIDSRTGLLRRDSYRLNCTVG